MRKQLIAGNWKMNLNLSKAKALAEALVEASETFRHLNVAVCPPSCYLEGVGKSLAGSSIALGAQNVYFEKDGAFTGEISTTMLTDLGCKYVILGHSERRHILGETDELINKKVLAALAAKLIPIVCVGELLEEREANRTNEVIQTQFKGSLAQLTAEQVEGIVIAYEPVWAIGTGKVATPQQAEEVHSMLRELISQQFGKETAEKVIIQYGGSVKPDNAAELLQQPNIDGALVGGASLKADQFLGIIAGAKK